MSTNFPVPMSSHRVNFAHLNLNLQLAYKAGGPGHTDDVLALVMHLLNSSPEFVEVKGSQASGFLSWADFTDPPVPVDHPDHGEDVTSIRQIETWLSMDREQLVKALMKADSEKRQLAYSLARVESMVQADQTV